MKPAKLLEQYYSACMAGDVAAGIRLLEAAAASRNDKLRRLRRKVTRRFVQQIEPAPLQAIDPLAARLIETYHDYYRCVLLKLKAGSTAEAYLHAKLSRLVKNHAARASLGELENALGNALRERGYFSLFGVVRPFRSLLIWRTESERTYRVTLPESVEEVRVHLLADFLTLGWLDFATFGKFHVGGWAKRDALYCVEKAYRIGSPTFVTNYLTHEAQHFSDYKRFPRLEGRDLEFGAKLAELSVARGPARLLQRFGREALDNRELPHAFASHALLRALAAESSSGGASSKLAAASLRAAAARALAAHSARLEALGARRVRSGL